MSVVITPFEGLTISMTPFMAVIIIAMYFMLSLTYLTGIWRLLKKGVKYPPVTGWLIGNTRNHTAAGIRILLLAIFLPVGLAAMIIDFIIELIGAAKNRT